jgi:hypothetical protein
MTENTQEKSKILTLPIKGVAVTFWSRILDECVDGWCGSLWRTRCEAEKWNQRETLADKTN